jgi:hypothetical protein
MTKRLPEHLKGAAHYRRSVRNVRPLQGRSARPDAPDRRMTDETPRRPVTLPRVLFLERPDPDGVVRPGPHIIEGTD